MRKYCLDCTIKHLAQACVLQIEGEFGYEVSVFLAIGHLSEAAEECFGASPELANEIRQYRLLLMDNPFTEIPFFELYNKVKELIKEKGCGNCKKASESFRDKILKKRETENGK